MHGVFLGIEIPAPAAQTIRKNWASFVLAFSTRTYCTEMPLHRLGEAREMTQVHLAKILGVNQAAVSKRSGAPICT